MRRSAWIFFASIFLPSLGLAWLAIRSVQDQQVLLEHQQVIISQNITDALAKNVQDQMDAVRADFVKTTQQLLEQSASPENLARDFNEKIHETWPMAEIGFAVNLDGEIYSPRLSDDRDALTFRKENDRFLSNRENAEIYSNSLNGQVANISPIFNSAPVAKGSVALGGFAQEKSMDAQRVDKQFAAHEVLDAAVKKKMESNQATAQSTQNGQADAASKAPALTLVPPTDSDYRLAPAPSATNAVAAGAASGVPADRRARVISNPTEDQAKDAEKASRTKAVSEAATTAVTDDLKMASAADASTSAVPVAAPAAASTAPAATDSNAVTVAPMGGATAASPPAPRQNEMKSSRDSAATTPSTSSVGPAATDQAEAIPVAAINRPAPTAPQALLENSDALDRVEAKLQKIQRQVIPQRMLSRDSAPVSNTLPADSDFRRVVGTDTSGELARFLENKLRLIVWSHTTAEAPIVFGAQLDNARLVAALQAALKVPEVDIRSSYDTVSTNYCTAILDDMGHPIALSRPGFAADWKHPFVATEIGEVLPHWEAALYQVDPQQIHHAARTVQWTIALIVLLLVAAIAAGGSLIAADVRRQVRLAQQKTDFVSNVSHELKTPLTSIRMFADLLAEKRVPDEEKQATYLRIIAAEASRLTRLINNVLDFARLDRGAKDAAPGEHRACDLVEAVRDVIDTCGPHLETAGVSLRPEIEADSLPIPGDRDALAQIILNLVSNAEKYGGGDILVRARRQETATGALGCIDVLDRGAGIPAAQVRTIFEPFQRLDDSLASGIPGSGLGLTLARRMARAHGGDVTYSARAGGGSCFTLTIPLEKIPA